MAFVCLSVIFPIICGICLLAVRGLSDRKVLLRSVGGILLAAAVFAILAIRMGYGADYTIFHLTGTLALEFHIDAVGALFAVMATIIFLCAGFFSFEYMSHEQNEKRYYGFYLIDLGVLYALCFSGNLITFYMFFELLTLCSVPLVLHNQEHEAVMAGLKYLFYSISGAYMALFGLYFIYKYGTTLHFTEGGVLGAAAQEQSVILLFAAFLMVIGFGVKAGMFPMHAWLPTAHPVAPAPASAVLSAVIVKAGVLALIRAVYYIFGVEFLRGTWVQNTWLILALITILMGSMLAYREKILKKRLAYSTVSQVSYILFGLALMNTEGITGAFIQILSHGFVKCALFLCAGAIIFKTGKTNVSQLRGIGKEMPILMWCYTIVSLGLIGIPPTGGFVGKWYLAAGALRAEMGNMSWVGPAVLLISALLTAGYLLPVAIDGFFPGEDYDYEALQKKEPSWLMNVPVVILTILSLVIGIWPDIFTGALSGLLPDLVKMAGLA